VAGNPLPAIGRWIKRIWTLLNHASTAAWLISLGVLGVVVNLATWLLSFSWRWYALAASLVLIVAGLYLKGRTGKSTVGEPPAPSVTPTPAPAPDPRPVQPPKPVQGHRKMTNAELVNALNVELTSGVEINSRITLIPMTALGPRPPTTSDVDGWEDRVASLLAPWPLKRARFLAARPESPIDAVVQGLTPPLKVRMEHRLKILEQIVQELIL
jgi:hypothetical protein